MIGMRHALLFFITGLTLCEFVGAQDTSVAGSEQAAEIIKTYEGRGTLADGSEPTPVNEALKKFRIRDGFEIELVASEPDIGQPLHISWDSKGRMLVTQYLQYQFPAGLKIVEYDNHLRAQFDKVPLPPPHGTKGADKITVFEDTTGDGKYDSHRDVITGLNIATSAVAGAGGIWVSNAPYLLFFPDADGDLVPDGDPEVKLSGFGIEDTHSVMNSLKWGPDGWLYGVNGSTTTGKVENPASGEQVEWQGQMVWRFHPTTSEFEIYAEGGGNTFSLDIDSAGRVFSGSNNGNTRGMYYPQGSYGKKSWGKHGPLTNPYAFGYFQHMAHEGDDRRFPQTFCIYEGGLYPESWNGKIIAGNSLHNIVWVSDVLPDGSTYKTVDEEPLVETDDRWFRPVFTGVGPDGCIYIADWYDSRLSHVRPVDDWHKASGRIYRIKPKGTDPKLPVMNLAEANTEDLADKFEDPNWFVRKRAVLESGWSSADDDRTPGSEFHKLLSDSGRSEDAFIWSVREDKNITFDDLPKSPSLKMRAQMASSAKRLYSATAMDIVRLLLTYDEDLSDPHMPLLDWWAVEAHAESGRSDVQTLVADPKTWESKMFREIIAERLMKRYAMAGGSENFASAALLLEHAPGGEMKAKLLQALQAAFEGLPTPSLPDSLSSALEEYARGLGDDGLVIRLKNGDKAAVAEAQKAIFNTTIPVAQRTELIRQLGAGGEASVVPSLLKVLALDQNSALKRVALQTLARFDEESVAKGILGRYGSTLPAEHGVRSTAERVLAGRLAWANMMMDYVDRAIIKDRDLSPDVVQLMLEHGDEELDARVQKRWPGIAAGSGGVDLAAETKRIKTVLAGSAGNADAGKLIFATRCATCHKLFNEGTTIGPDLTPYERNNLDFWIPAIVNPSLELREGFLNYVATMADGRKVIGLMQERTPQTVTLRDLAGQEQTLNLAEVEKLEASPISLMPAGLLVGLSDSELRDFFAYLMKE